MKTTDEFIEEVRSNKGEKTDKQLKDEWTRIKETLPADEREAAEKRVGTVLAGL